MGAGNHMNRDELANATGGGGACVCSRLDRSHVAGIVDYWHTEMAP